MNESDRDGSSPALGGAILFVSGAVCTLIAILSIWVLFLIGNREHPSTPPPPIVSSVEKPAEPPIAPAVVRNRQLAPLLVADEIGGIKGAGEEVTPSIADRAVCTFPTTVQDLNACHFRQFGKPLSHVVSGGQWRCFLCEGNGVLNVTGLAGIEQINISFEVESEDGTDTARRNLTAIALQLAADIHLSAQQQVAAANAVQAAINSRGSFERTVSGAFRVVGTSESRTFMGRLRVHRDISLIAIK